MFHVFWFWTMHVGWVQKRTLETSTSDRMISVVVKYELCCVFSAGKEEKAIDVGGFKAKNMDTMPMKDHVKECKIWAQNAEIWPKTICQDPSHPAFILMNSICMKSCYVRAVSVTCI